MEKTANATNHKPIKLALIEDEEALRFMYVTRFRQAGFEVAEASDGDKGLELIRTFRPDIVLLDIMMPKMNGFDVFRALKQDSDASVRDIPVVFLTNLSEDAGFEQAQKLGAAGYVMKVKRTPDEVVQLVKTILSSEKAHTNG